VVILDFGRCYSAAALDSIPELDTLFLLTTQDLPQLENAREFLRLSAERGKDSDRVKVLLNKVPTRQKPDLDGIESFLGVRPAAVFSDDTEALYEIWSEGRMLDGKSVLGRQLKALTKSMLVPAEPEATSGMQQPVSSAVANLAAAVGLGRFFSFARSSRA
jgi:Flp pilus assembly CpaE family ATPase